MKKNNNSSKTTEPRPKTYIYAQKNPEDLKDLKDLKLDDTKQFEKLMGINHFESNINSENNEEIYMPTNARDYLIGRGGFGYVVWGIRYLKDTGKKEWIAIKLANIPNFEISQLHDQPDKEPEKILEMQKKILDAMPEATNEFRLLGHMGFKVYAQGFTSKPRLFIAMERLPNLPLFKEPIDETVNPRIAEASTQEKIFWIIQLLQQLKKLHIRGFIHRDITGPNILFNEKNNQFVIIDFGTAEYLPSNSVSQPNTVLKTPRKRPTAGAKDVIATQRKPNLNKDFLGTTGYFLSEKTDPNSWTQVDDLQRLIAIIAVILGKSPKAVYNVNENNSRDNLNARYSESKERIYVQDTRLSFDNIELITPEEEKRRGIEINSEIITFLNKFKANDISVTIEAAIDFFRQIQHRLEPHHTNGDRSSFLPKEKHNADNPQDTNNSSIPSPFIVKVEQAQGSIKPAANEPLNMGMIGVLCKVITHIFTLITSFLIALITSNQENNEVKTAVTPALSAS